MNLIIEEQEVYAQQVGNYIDIICRATSKEAWEAATVGKLLDTETLHPLEGVLIDIVGPIELAEGVFDNRYHVNVRFYDYFNWQPIVLKWMQEGKIQKERNNLEETILLNSVSLINADTITSQTRVWSS